ncbi:MAG: chemotaxis protein CheA [Planctomycetota bacterium]|nr:chemotaxis protein CheA [Planctomycetota bacterium]
MTITPAIEQLAKTSVLIDEHDLPALVELHERMRGVLRELEAVDLAAVTDCLEQSDGLLQQIIYRETENAAAALDQIRAGIDFAQRAVAADEEGRPLSEVGASPFEASPARREPIDAELLASWIASCASGLGEIEGLAVSLDTGSAPADAMAELRRRLHTLKGECGVLSLREAQQLCHAAETMIDSCGAALSRMQPVLEVVDWMRGYIGTLANDALAPAPEHRPLLETLRRLGEACALPPASPAAEASDPVRPAQAPAEAAPAVGTPVDLSVDPAMQGTLQEFLCEAREHIAQSEHALLELEKHPGDRENINTVFRAFHTIKGVAGFLNLAPVVSLAHSTEFLLDAARSGRVTLDHASLGLVLRSCDMMAALIRALEGGGAAPTGEQLGVLIAEVERATRGEHTASTTGTPATPAREHPAAGDPAGSAPAPEAPAGPTPGTAQAPNAIAKRADQTVKVSTLRMDALVDMVGELVIAQQMVVQDPAVRGLREQRVSRNLAMVGKIIRDLQEVSMSLRMVPVKATFQKMGRLVRDVSAKSGKRVTLHTEGEDVEIDRTVVEEIADPLVHMIRNSCDHGIEPADVRRAAGKPDGGNIWLRAYHSGGSILVEVQDDGKGLDRDRILAKAIERGIYTADRPLQEIPDAEVFNLIFLPGFSTAERITDLSGRGVGMDVVRRNIEALRGTIDIDSKPGQGTLFTLRLPLTLAIIDGMVVRSGTQRFVIPTLSIERSFKPTPALVNTVLERGRMARVRDGLLPIYRLDSVLAGRTSTDTPADELLVVVECRGTRACLSVDEIIGQQQVVIKGLGQGTHTIPGVSGGAILGDGRVALILDVGGILGGAASAAAS